MLIARAWLTGLTHLSAYATMSEANALELEMERFQGISLTIDEFGFMKITGSAGISLFNSLM